MSVYLVVALMGLRMGSNEEVTSSLGTIGVQSLIATVFVVAGSFIFVTITRKILRIDRHAHRHEKGEISKEELKEKRANTKIQVDSENLKMTVIIVSKTMIFGFPILSVISRSRGVKLTFQNLIRSFCYKISLTVN